MKFFQLLFVIALASATYSSGSLQAGEEATTGNSLGAEIWVGAPIVGESPCELLVRRVCGENRDCGDRPACVRVRELLEKERRERAASGRPGRMTLASGQCQEADRDRESYRSCER